MEAVVARMDPEVLDRDGGLHAFLEILAGDTQPSLERIVDHERAIDKAMMSLPQAERLVDQITRNRPKYERAIEHLKSIPRGDRPTIRVPSRPVQVRIKPYEIPVPAKASQGATKTVSSEEISQPVGKALRIPWRRLRQFASVVGLMRGMEWIVDHAVAVWGLVSEAAAGFHELVFRAGIKFVLWYFREPYPTRFDAATDGAAYTFASGPSRFDRVLLAVFRLPSRPFRGRRPSTPVRSNYRTVPCTREAGAVRSLGIASLNTVELTPPSLS